MLPPSSQYHSIFLNQGAALWVNHAGTHDFLSTEQHSDTGDFSSFAFQRGKGWSPTELWAQGWAGPGAVSDTHLRSCGRAAAACPTRRCEQSSDCTCCTPPLSFRASTRALCFSVHKDWRLIPKAGRFFSCPGTGSGRAVQPALLWAEIQRTHPALLSSLARGTCSSLMATLHDLQRKIKTVSSSEKEKHEWEDLL